MTAEERVRVETLSALARCNPFLPERKEHERATLGDAFEDVSPVWSKVLRRFTEVRATMGVRVLRTPPFVPQANGYYERLTCTTRRECLDFLIPLSEKHLRRLLCEWRDYNNSDSSGAGV